MYIFVHCNIPLFVHSYSIINKNIGKKISSKGIWEGKAADFYVEKITKLTKNFDEVYSEMENSILFMANCAEGYEAIDRQVIKEICSKLKITTPNLSTSNIFN